MAGRGYETASRRRILDFLKSNESRAVTAADIADYLKESGSEVNITTIYRYLDKLAHEGTVMKYVSEKGGKAAYQYVERGHRCKEHLHLKCVCCGSIFHLECDFMNEISMHIREEHKFELQCQNSVLYGTCSRCREKG